MRNPDPAELDRIAAERAAMFRPDWFGRLARGDLRLGETFWSGHLGVQFVLMPLWLIMVVIIPMVSEGLGWWVTLAFLIIESAWSVTVTRAVILVAGKAPSGGSVRWIAVGISVLATAQLLILSGMWVTGQI